MDWGEWTPCSATCDTGLRQRNRIKEVAETGGGTCTGQPIESELCKENDCGKIIFNELSYSEKIPVKFKQSKILYFL